MIARLLPTLLFVATSRLLAQADTLPANAGTRTGFLDETIAVAGTEHRYVLYVPPGYTKDRRWPLIVFLNGAGECGTDGQKQISVGLAPAIRNDMEAWPFLVLFPQKPDRASAWEDHDAMVMAMLGKAREQYAVDEKQLFLTGLSQGGHGTWVLGARHANVWAAIAPICGYGDPGAIAPALKNMSIWCFHGEDDKSVPVQQSKNLCKAVEAAGGHAELSLYPKIGHNSWDKAYRDDPLAEWLLLTATDRVGARYIARPELATTATVTIRDEWSMPHAPDRPLSRGTTTATLELATTGLSWRIVQTTKLGPDQKPRGGMIAGDDGKQLLVRQLRSLQASGAFHPPAAVRPRSPATGEAAERHGFTLDVTLDGQPGPWRFHGDISPDAAGNPDFGRQQEAIAACCRAIGALN